VFSFLETAILRWTDPKNRSLWSQIVCTLLTPVSVAYKWLVKARNWGYDTRFFKRYSPPGSVVISVGNISAGGTGKTPLSILLAKRFADRYRTAVIARGYRSAAEHSKGPLVMSLGEGPKLTPSQGGDEAYLLSKKVPAAYVFVGKNRIQSAILASQHETKILLLEDGLQHRKVERDLDIVLLDSVNPTGDGLFVPLGFLRDCPTTLRRASHLVVNLVEGHSEQLETVEQRVRPFTDAPLIGVRTVLDRVVDFAGGEIELEEYQKVALFSGIAKPERFHSLVKSTGVEVVSEYNYANHTLPSEEKLFRFSKRAKEAGATMLLTTEKDAVKFYETPMLALPIGIVETKMEVVHGEETLNQLIEAIEEKVEHL